ncbi:hypothetical protein J1N35_045482 [Gossypium stocksii]|uniref:DUF4283 domain-containing protein n=1 Tax=Gossypium stocksii TaxID=47602 RepID=A0A9D3ZHF3_9ROSI|nr:hypothetical protein J1N35_045482 [Gossypium stocksii]
MELLCSPFLSRILYWLNLLCATPLLFWADCFLGAQLCYRTLSTFPSICSSSIPLHFIAKLRPVSYHSIRSGSFDPQFNEDNDKDHQFLESEDCSLLLPQFDDRIDRDSHSCEDRTTKKMRFNDGIDETSADMAVDHEPPQLPSWKDKLLGGVPVSFEVSHNAASMGSDSESDGNFALLDDDMQTSIVNGVSAINFSNRVKEILFKEMELTVVIKLLGRSIGYNILHNHIISLWKPISLFNLMDIENEYYLPDAAISYCGFGVDLANRAPGFLFRWKIVEAIGGLTGKVIKLDLQTDNRSRCHFAQLAVFLNLEKPLVSKVLVDGAVQRVEYEAPPTVYFRCGKYGHVKDICLTVVEDRVLKHLMEMMNVDSVSTAGENVEEAGSDFGPWILVERQS